MSIIRGAQLAQPTGSFATTGSNTFIGSQIITGSLAISGSINNTTYIDFDPNATIGTNAPAWKEGRLFYDTGSGALALYNWERDVTLNIGQEQWLRARNQTGVTITNGSVVKLVGAIGDRPTIALAQSSDQTNTFSLDNEIIGMATHDIEHGTDGFVTTFGLVNGLDTSAYSSGDILWVSQSAGKFTSTAPSAPFDKTFVGIVTRANANNGSVFMTPLTPIHFHDISSVSASTYQMGDLWMYRSGSAGQSNAWINTKQLTGSYFISGGLNVNGPLVGTSSWANNAVSSSYALTASYALNGGSGGASFPYTGSAIISGSLIVTGSINASSITGSLLGTASWSSNALTASFVTTSQTASYVLQAVSASFATLAQTANTASYVVTAQTASYVLNAVSSSFASTASYILNAVSSSLTSTASFVQTAQSASYILQAVSSSFASTASYLNTLNQDLTFNGNLTLNGTASISYLNVTFESASVIYSTGSNQFGDAANDVQTLYGSVIVPTGSLTVTGSVRLRGTGSTSATNALTIQNSSGTTLLITRDDGLVTAGASGWLGIGETSRYLYRALNATGIFTIANDSTIGSSFDMFGSSHATLPNLIRVTAPSSLQVTGSLIATSFTGSLQGTASWSVTASNALTASYVLQAVSSSFASTASYVLNAVSSSFASTASYVLNAVSSSFASTASYVTGSIHTSTNPALSASYALTASNADFLDGYHASQLILASQTSSMTVLSSSFASTASYVNTLNQSVLITGSLTVGSGSLGPSENTITLGARDSVNEGGQLGFNPPGGTYASASFLDNYQNRFRLMRGHASQSDAEVASWNMHTKQMSLPAYNSVSAFAGTAAANLAVDASGNVITVSTSGGTVFPYVGNAVITGSLTVTQAIYAQANGAMYFQGGDDAALYDINVSNHMGIYGVQDSTVGAIKLGSNGAVLYGSGSKLGVNTTNPSSASLTVNGNIWATSFTGSLQGTASWASNVVTASYAGTASFLNIGTYNVTSSWAVTASQAISSSYSFTSSYAVSASYIFPGTYAVTSSWAVTASVAISASNAVTASYVTGSIHTSANPALSASYALTASYALNGGSGATFPYIGDAVITGSLIVSGSRGGINTSDRYLIDGGGVVSVDWASRALTDAANVQSLDYDGRYLTDVAGTGAMDWRNRILIDSAGYYSINWASRYLYDSTGGGVVIIDYSNERRVGIGAFVRTTVTSQQQDWMSGNRAQVDMWSGQTIVASLDNTVSIYDLCYLHTDGVWYPVSNTTVGATKMLGICVDTANYYMLLEGDILVNNSNDSYGPYLGTITTGEPVYIAPTAGKMTQTPPTGNYIRTLGHPYYRNVNENTDHWLLKFRPSNDWYKMIE